MSFYYALVRDAKTNYTFGRFKTVTVYGEVSWVCLPYQNLDLITHWHDNGCENLAQVATLENGIIGVMFYPIE